MNTRLLGDQGLATAILHYTRLGHVVSVPTSEATRYDLVVDDGECLQRIQVKTTTFRDKPSDYYTVNLGTSGGGLSTHEGRVTIRRISTAECDLVFVLTADGTAWELPAEVAAGRRMLCLHPGRASFIVGRYPPLVTELERRIHVAQAPLVPPLRQRGTQKPGAKLTDQAVREIRASNESDRALAVRYDVSRVVIQKARRGETWSHVA